MRSTMLAIGLMFAATPSAAATLQEQYAAAQSAFDAGRMTEARAGFAAVLPRLDNNPRMKVQAAIVRARIGAAANAMGEPEAAIALIAAALPALDPASVDWRVAALGLGSAQELAIDFEGAAATYLSVLDRAADDPVARLTAQTGAARTIMFRDPAAARILADAALAEGEAGFTGKRRELYAALLALRGRIELLAGQPAAAKVWLTRAVARAGGLGARVSITDVRVRGDMALAAYLAGDLINARMFFAYTGAGAMPAQGFELGADMPLPACAPIGEVQRDDMAIVEFSIGEDGRVTGVTPIYASRGGTAALVFARAVRGWSWRPEAAKALNIFWRQAVRLELRCAGSKPGYSFTVREAAANPWLERFEALPPLPPGAAAALPLLRTELSRRIAKHGPSSPELLSVLLAIDANKVRPESEASLAIASAMSIAAAAKAPDDLRTVIRIRQAEVDAGIAAGSKHPTGPLAIRSLETLQAALAAEGLDRTRGAALVAHQLALWYATDKATAKVSLSYQRILALPETALPAGDNLRQLARLQLATIEASVSRLDNARALLAETGLTAEQCSLVPVPPQVLNTSVSSSDFPAEAQQWGFDGMVRLAFDIGTDGKPVGVRTVIAHPPMVFNASSARVVQRSRYRPAFRDGAGIACADEQRPLHYRILR